MDDETIYELMSIKRKDELTLSSVLLFSPYPQAYFPQLCITAIVVPGNELGNLGESGERFIDNERIEGNISEMLDSALQFVKGICAQKPSLIKRQEKGKIKPIIQFQQLEKQSLMHWFIEIIAFIQKENQSRSLCMKIGWKYTIQVVFMDE